MDSERRYKEALELARDYYKANQKLGESEENEVLSDIFPELAESENEQSKKWILEYLYDGLRKSDEQFKGQFKAAIAWLEKQDDKPFDYENANIRQKDFAPRVEPKFKVGDRVNKNDREDEEHCILTITSVNIDEHCYICDQCSVIDFGEQDLWHIVEQKPAWSEEDEKIFCSLLNTLTRISLTTRTDTTSVNYSFYTEIEWLKSLKERHTWKPSDEQMNLLEELVKDNNQRYFHTTLNSLYEQLKKLKEE